MIEFAARNLISIRLDAEKGEGIDIAKEYGVRSYPIMVFIRSDGSEIDRIIGYRPPDLWLKDVNRILSGIDTYESLVSKLGQFPQDTTLLFKLAEKTENMDDLLKAKELWESILSLTQNETTANKKAQYKLAEIKTRKTGDVTPLMQYISNNPQSRHLLSAYQWVLRNIRSSGDKEKEVGWYQQYMHYMEESDNETPDFLNGYAWRMTELNTNLEDALIKVRHAVSMSKDSDPMKRAQIMDTEAEVLWKLGQVNEAVEVIENCIALQPEDDYYKEQKNKFLQTTPSSK